MEGTNVLRRSSDHVLDSVTAGLGSACPPTPALSAPSPVVSCDT